MKTIRKIRRTLVVSLSAVGLFLSAPAWGETIKGSGGAPAGGASGGTASGGGGTVTPPRSAPPRSNPAPPPAPRSNPVPIGTAPQSPGASNGPGGGNTGGSNNGGARTAGPTSPRVGEPVRGNPPAGDQGRLVSEPIRRDGHRRLPPPSVLPLPDYYYNWPWYQDSYNNSGYGYNDNGNGNYTDNTNTQPAQDQANADAQAQREAAARAAALGARQDMNDAQVRSQQQLEASDAYRSALAEQRIAQSDYDAATRPALDALRAKPEYQEAAEQKRKLQGQIEATQAAYKKSTDAAAPPEAMTAAATRVLDVNTRLTRMESEALASDSRVADARRRLIEATTKINALRKQAGLAALATPEYKAAQRTLEANGRDTH